MHLFHSLENQRLRRVHFATRSEAFDAVQAYIDAFYNPVRRQSALRHLSPIDFENGHRALQTAT